VSKTATAVSSQELSIPITRIFPTAFAFYRGAL
jgi:hypothetical protein